MKEVNLTLFNKILEDFEDEVCFIVESRRYGNKEDWTIPKIQKRYFWKALKRFGLGLFLREMIAYKILGNSIVHSYYKTTAWQVAEEIVNDNYYKILDVEDSFYDIEPTEM